MRSELLVKLALIDRSGGDPRSLINAQRTQLGPVAAALHDRLASATGFDRTLILWRCETVSATMRFLDALQEEPLTTIGRSTPARAVPTGVAAPRGR